MSNINYEELDKKFHLELEKEERTSRNIVKKIAEIYEEHAKRIEIILQGDNSLINIQESAVFSEKDRAWLIELLRQLMRLLRKFQEIDLLGEGYDNIISEFSENWESIKPELIKLFQKLQNAWNGDFENKIDINYLG